MAARVPVVVRPDHRGRHQRDPEEHHQRTRPRAAPRRTVGAAREEGRLTVDFDFSPAQYELRDEARAFLRKECTSDHVREFVDDPSGWSRGLWKQIADLGWMALPFPEEYGGLGQGLLDLVLLLEELGAALAPVPFLSSVALAGLRILHHGGDQQKARWLPDVASGDRVAAAVLPAFEHDVDCVPIRAKD